MAKRKSDQPDQWHVWYALDTKANRAKGRRKLRRLGCIDIEYRSQYIIADDRMSLAVIGRMPRRPHG